LHRDVLDTKAEIRAALDRLAERNRIAAKDVAYAIDGYADNLLDDTIYSVKGEARARDRRLRPGVPE
jgi:hypothetical protein